MSANLSFLANHLWQSTAIAGIIALIALALRKNHASIRYSLWLAASLKFLLTSAASARRSNRILMPRFRS